MPRRLEHQRFDVLVVGGGAAGVVAAAAASRCGARTALIERGTATGGEMISGLAILGSSNSRGEWLIGGPAKEFIERCDELGGFAGRPFDGRTMWGACVDPEVMKLVVPERLAEAGVAVYLGATATDVVATDGTVHGVIVEGRADPILFTAPAFVDASGDAFVSVLAGADYEQGAPDGTLQPVSLTFRVAPVDYGVFLTFVRDHPEEFMLAESDVITKSAAECAADIYASGMPFVCLQAEGENTLMRQAMRRGELFPTTGIYMYPTAPGRGEMGLNTTRLVGVDPFDTGALSRGVSVLGQQALQTLDFLRTDVPGYGRAQISGVASRVGIRETRRIIGEARLETDDVIEGRKREDVVAKGGHHVDVHGSGTEQKRIHVKGGKSYDIPFGALVPRKVANVLVAGRCFSSSREANGSARHMGSCMSMGQAAGTAAALTATDRLGNVRELDVKRLQRTLTEHGAILGGIA